MKIQCMLCVQMLTVSQGRVLLCCAVNPSLERGAIMVPCHLSLATGDEQAHYWVCWWVPGSVRCSRPQAHLEDLMDGFHTKNNVASAFLQINACRSPVILLWSGWVFRSHMQIILYCTIWVYIVVTVLVVLVVLEKRAHYVDFCFC